MREDEFYRDRTDEPIKEAPKDEEFLPTKSRRRSWSVAAFSFGVLSLILSLWSFVGIAVGAVAVILSVISRYKLGYFDRFGVLALVFGVFGLGVCSLFTIFKNVPFFN